jgi:hypothetical protein
MTRFVLTEFYTWTHLAVTAVAIGMYVHYYDAFWMCAGFLHRG